MGVQTAGEAIERLGKVVVTLSRRDDKYSRNEMVRALEAMADFAGGNVEPFSAVVKQQNPDWSFEPTPEFVAMYAVRDSSNKLVTWSDGEVSFDVSTPKLFAQAALSMLGTVYMDHHERLSLRVLEDSHSVLHQASKVLQDAGETGWDSQVIPLSEARAAWSILTTELPWLKMRFTVMQAPAFTPMDLPENPPGYDLIDDGIPRP